MKISFFLLAALILFSSSALINKSVDADVIDVKDVVKHLKKNFIGNMRKSPHAAKAHFRETVLTGDTYTGYYESIGYGIYLGEKNGNVAPYTKYKFYAENVKAKLNTSPSTTACLRESLRFRYYGPFSNNGFSYSLNENDLDKDYFTIKCLSKKEADPNFSEVHVKVDRESLNVIEVIYQTKTLFSMVKNDRLKGDVIIKYTYINNEPFVSNIETAYKKGDLTHKTSYKLLEQELETFDLSKDEFWAFNAYDHYPYIKYEKSQWDQLGISTADDYDKIKSDLGEEIPLDEYFVENSLQWMHYTPQATPKRHLELAQNKMSELINIFN